MAEVQSGSTPVPRLDFGPSLFAGLACLMDILLLQGWLRGQSAMIEVIALHICFALAIGAVAMLVRRGVSQSILVRVIILILFGPLGGPALMIAMPAASASRPEKAGAAPATARPSANPVSADDLFDQIMQGRRHPLPQRPFSSFLKTFTAGTFNQQQEAIAAMSRSYHPDMRPALGAALASPIPALRVQAAAVYAKLRSTHEARAKELLVLSKTDDLPSAPDLAADCLTVAESGFVDAETQSLLRKLSARLAGSTPPHASPPAQRHASQMLRPALQPAPRLKRYACGGLG